MRSNDALLAIEALEVPVVVAINGFALGGGLELALAGDYRVMSATAMVGLPEVKLGLFPRLGGTVPLARVAGATLANDWITGGAQAQAPDAVDVGVVDAGRAAEALRCAGLDTLPQATATERMR